MSEGLNLGLNESLVFSPHMHAVFHRHISKDTVTWPIKVTRPALYRVELTDSADGMHYHLATLYYGREATQKQINEAVESLKAILTLRLA